MLLSSLLLLAQFTATLAQTALTSPITGFTIPNRTGYRWDLFRANIDFAFTDAEAAAIGGGDFFTFTISGEWIPNPNVTPSYDFFITDNAGNNLFQVTSSDGLAFQATATSFFDNNVVTSLNGQFTVEFIFNDWSLSVLTDHAVNVDSFTDSVNILQDMNFQTIYWVTFRRQGNYLASHLDTFFDFNAPVTPVRYAGFQVDTNSGFSYEPTDLLWGFERVPVYIDDQWRLDTSQGSPESSDLATDGSFTSTTQTETRLNPATMPVAGGTVAGLFQTAQGKFDGSGRLACFTMSANYEGVDFTSTSFCVEPGSGVDGLPNGEGLANVVVEVQTTSAETTSAETTSAETSVETTSAETSVETTSAETTSAETSETTSTVSETTFTVSETSASETSASASETSASSIETTSATSSVTVAFNASISVQFSTIYLPASTIISPTPSGPTLSLQDLIDAITDYFKKLTDAIPTVDTQDITDLLKQLSDQIADLTNKIGSITPIQDGLKTLVDRVDQLANQNGSSTVTPVADDLRALIEKLQGDVDAVAAGSVTVTGGNAGNAAPVVTVVAAGTPAAPPGAASPGAASRGAASAAVSNAPAPAPPAVSAPAAPAGPVPVASSASSPVGSPASPSGSDSGPAQASSAPAQANTANTLSVGAVVALTFFALLA